METSAEGIRALWISLAILGGTALLQAAVVAVSGSVALLGDTLHNAADALTAVPLGIAFLVGRRPPNRRYTYGYGRAEDLAGVTIVLIIAASSALVAYEAVTRLAHPRPVSNLIAVSVAVLLGVGGAAAGWAWADPVVGLLITVAILAVLRQAAREIYRRLMDAVDPALVDQVERTLRATPGVLDVGQVRLRWIGHQLRAECEVIVGAGTSAIQAHQAAVDAEHNLLHALPRLAAALVHADPQGQPGADHHAVLASHR